MHELSVAGAIVDTVVRAAEGRPVSAVTLRIGHLRQVVPDSLAFYLEIVSRETICEGATFEQIAVPARLRCRGCEETWTVTAPAFRCPACAGSDVEIVAGKELEVESIEVEMGDSTINEESTACTA